MRNSRLKCVISVAVVVGVLLPATAALGSPLTVSTSNPRYVQDDSGKVIYLTGSHIWNNFIDWGTSSPPSALNHGNFVDWLDGYDHNFVRGWCWEIAEGLWLDWTPYHWYFYPDVFTRSGTCSAGDGKNKFNLTGTTSTYLDRVRNRSLAYRNNDPTIYNGISMFIGASPNSDGWVYYPFKLENNTNSIDGDKDNDDDGEEIHSLPSQYPYIAQAVIDREEEYIADVIDKVNDLDSVIWEIGNELPAGSVSWQYHMIDYIKSYEAAYKSKQHLVWMNTYHFPNSDMFASNADILSPNGSWGDAHYKSNPARNTTGRVVVLDSDHLWGIGGDSGWIWKGFTRGYNMIFMDPYWGNPWKPDLTAYEAIRTAMGATRRYAERMDFSVVEPKNTRSSTSNCLSDETNHEWYLAYACTSQSTITIQPLASGEYYYEWIDHADGDLLETGTATGTGSNKLFTNPGTYSALYLVNIDDGVSIDMERFDDVRGVIVKNSGDGDNVPATIGGRDCRKNEVAGSDKYMYFDVEDDWAYQGSLTEVWVTLEYYDTGTENLTLTYDCTDGTVYKNAGSKARTDTDTWLSYTWHITDAYFGNRQNNSADFRIRGSSDDTFYYDIVAVSDTDPNPGPPDAATNPSPSSGATNVKLSQDLSWTAGSGADSHDVYFGTDSTPDEGEFKVNQSGTTYEPGTLSSSTTYYWRIDEVNGNGTTTGTVWSFTTYGVPGSASSPSPANSATDVSVSADLSWTAGANAESHDVYFGTDATPDETEFEGNQSGTTFDPGTMSYSTTYYWRIDEKNEAGTTTGTVWSFTTGSEPPCPDNWVAIDLGSTDNENCLYRSNEGSGQGSTTSASIDGRDCRTNLRTGTDRYFYYDVEDDWAYQGSKTEVWITFNYYDNNSTGYFRCAYDGTGGDTTQTSELYLSGDNKWKYHTWHITDAYFGNRQNGDSDFRIYRSYYSVNFYIDKVRVSDIEPETVYVDLGSTDIEDGLNRPASEPGDGTTESSTKGDRSCRRNVDTETDHYVYLQIDDDYAYQGDRTEVWVTADYWDNSNGYYELQYDGSSATTTQSDETYVTDSMTWMTYTWHITDGYFGNRQNGSSDIRIYKSGGYSLYLDVVEVSNLGWAEY